MSDIAVTAKRSWQEKTENKITNYILLKTALVI
jgi:hypothetical protein